MNKQLQLFLFLLIPILFGTAGKASAQADTVYYPYYKEMIMTAPADSFFTDAMVGDVRTAAQAYHLNGSVEILGVQFWGAAYSTSTAPQTLPVTVLLYEVDAFNMPTNILASTEVTITEQYDFYEVNFPTSVTYDKNFAVAVKSKFNDTLAVITNNAGNVWSTNYGEGLGWRKFGSGTWNSSLSFFGQDLEYMIFPIVKHTVKATFTKSDDSVCPGSAVTFTNTSSGIFGNRMFNIHAFNKYWNQAPTDSTFSWNYDGSDNWEVSANGSKTYTSSGDYQVKLVGEMLGYNVSWSDTMIVSMKVNPVYNESISKSVCSGQSYVFGSHTLTSAGTYTEVFQSTSGCDSTVVLTLSVNPVYNETASKSICSGGSYVFGSQTLTSAGTYTEVFQSTSGCDSTVVLTLSVNPVYNETVSKSICAGGSYIFGSQTLTSAGTYTEVFQSTNGCDSTVVLTLSENPVYNETVSKSICTGGSYTFGSQTLTAAGTYTEVFQSVNGCDSTVVLTLSVTSGYNETIAKSICAGESYSFGSQTLTAAGTYTEAFESVSGCDSTVVLTLTVNPVFNETAAKSICAGESYTFGSQTLTSAGTYTEVFESVRGCDSTVVLTLTVTSIDATVTAKGATLTANTAGATYQWINCDHGNSPLVGETSASFTATESGNYAVVITKDNCSATSDCVPLVVTGIERYIRDSAMITIRPNPSSGAFTIDCQGIIADEIIITNSLGRMVQRLNPSTSAVTVSLENEPTSVYLVKVLYKNSSQMLKVVIK